MHAKSSRGVSSRTGPRTRTLTLTTTTIMLTLLIALISSGLVEGRSRKKDKSPQYVAPVYPVYPMMTAPTDPYQTGSLPPSPYGSADSRFGSTPGPPNALVSPPYSTSLPPSSPPPPQLQQQRLTPMPSAPPPYAPQQSTYQQWPYPSSTPFSPPPPPPPLYPAPSSPSAVSSIHTPPTYAPPSAYGVPSSPVQSTYTHSTPLLSSVFSSITDAIQRQVEEMLNGTSQAIQKATQERVAAEQRRQLEKQQREQAEQQLRQRSEKTPTTSGQLTALTQQMQGLMHELNNLKAEKERREQHQRDLERQRQLERFLQQQLAPMVRQAQQQQQERQQRKNGKPASPSNKCTGESVRVLEAMLEAALHMINPKLRPCLRELEQRLPLSMPAHRGDLEQGPGVGYHPPYSISGNGYYPNPSGTYASRPAPETASQPLYPNWRGGYYQPSPGIFSGANTGTGIGDTMYPPPSNVHHSPFPSQPDMDFSNYQRNGPIPPQASTSPHLSSSRLPPPSSSPSSPFFSPAHPTAVPSKSSAVMPDLFGDY